MKNWFVGVEQKTKKSGDSVRTKKRDAKNLENGIVKQITKKKNSLKSCVDYLLSKKHENHINTTIYEIGNVRNDLSNILDEVGSVRLKNAATSFCASLPADLYHPSKTEWENIYNSTMENYCDALNKELEKLEKAHHKKSIPKDERRKKEYHLNTERYSQRLDINEMKRLSICVIHDDRNKPLIIGETSGSQMNLLISNVIDNKVIKLMSQKSGIELFKKSYVNAVKNELGLDPKNYLTYEDRLTGKEHKDFYDGPSNVELLKLESCTPRKKRKDQELRVREEKKSHYKAYNEKLASVVVREAEADQKLEQVPRAKELIKTANIAIREKKNATAATTQAKTDLKKIEKKKKTAKTDLIKIKKQIRRNESWFVNFVKSEPIKEYLNSVRPYFEKGFNFKLFQEVTGFIRGLEKSNEEMINKIKASNPAWLKEQEEKAKQIAEEKRIKHENRFSGREYIGEIELIEELKEETKPEIKKESFKEKAKRKLGFY